MTIRNVECKMKVEDKKFILNYLKDPDIRKEMQKEKIKGIQQNLRELRVAFVSVQELYQSAQNIQLQEVYAKEMEIQEIEIQRQRELFAGFEIIGKLYTDIDIALFCIEPRAQKAIDLYYRKSFSYKELTQEFSYSIQYIRAIIMEGLNEIYEHLSVDELAKARGFLLKNSIDNSPNV